MLSEAPVLRLASASPRRRELLASIRVPVELCSVDVDETPLSDEIARDYVLRLARDKALAGSLNSELPCLGADTAVVLDGTILGKPRDQAHAAEMLTALAGTHHQVLTAVAITGPAGLLSSCVTSRVTLRDISDAEIAAYWATGEPHDKAGGYAIQGLAAIFVADIQGSYSAVVGLPLYETAELLTRQGVPLWPGSGLAVS